MRALRVVGVTGDGSVVLEDPSRRERYTVPADEQLRAAARGDVTRLGQIAIELESQLRPREIQARIRGGASVAQVADAAGVPVQKIERFAYPVLLERSRTAELAQGAHPQRADGPDVRTLGETVAHTFGLRGQDYAAAGWDSWKGDDGRWVVALSWRAGRSDNAAHWSFQPGAHGGTVVALDEHASDLVEGLPARPLRTVGPVIEIGRDDDAGPDEPESPQVRAAAAGETRRGIAPEQRRSSPPSRTHTATTPTASQAESTRSESARSEPPHVGSAGPAGGTTAGSDASVAGARPDTSAGAADTARSRADTAPSSGDATGGGVSSPVREPASDRSESDRSESDRSESDRSGTDRPGTDRTTATASGAAASGSAAADDTAADDTAADDTATDTGDGPGDVDVPAATADTRVPPASESDTPADTGRRDAEGAEPPSENGTEQTTPENGDSTSGRTARGTAATRRTKKGKPVMPSWDEVLLGVRGQR